MFGEQLEGLQKLVYGDMFLYAGVDLLPVRRHIRQVAPVHDAHPALTETKRCPGRTTSTLTETKRRPGRIHRGVTTAYDKHLPPNRGCFAAFYPVQKIDTRVVLPCPI
jgi:hypothetical protein